MTSTKGFGRSRDHLRERPAFIDGPATVYDAFDEIQRVLDAHVRQDGPIRLLEAGCGSCSHFSLDGDVHATGIDISQKQLDRNTALDEKIQGDLETYPLPAQQYDLVVCWYVLEHLSNPDQALRNMMQSLAPGGLLIIAVPLAYSIKGLITKFTPHWFHVLVYRRLLGRKNAGRDDQPPFPAFLRWSIRPGAIERTARASGLEVVRGMVYEDHSQRKIRTDFKSFRFAYAVLNVLIKLVTLGRGSSLWTDYAVVLARPAAEQHGAPSRRADAKPEAQPVSAA